MSNEYASKEVKLVPVAPIPRLTRELIAFLDQNFPERCADLGDGVPEIFHRAGQRSVVKYLIRIYEDQNDNAL